MTDSETFRSEVRQWLVNNAPHSIRGQTGPQAEGAGNWGGKKATYDNPDMKAWLEMMAERGWTAPEWPKEYGGGGLSKSQAKVLHQEMATLKLPLPLIGFGVAMIGPTLLVYGSEEQKREHLP
ncbi:MAG: acyl-CoA dehydrogenase family protein, partial [Candidatus Binatia bacterium]